MSDINNQDNQIILYDDQGNEQIAQIIFTFSDDDNNHYVFLTKLGEVDDYLEESIVEVYRYEPLEDGCIGNLFEIDQDDEKTWDMINEVFATFNENGFDPE